MSEKATAVVVVDDGDFREWVAELLRRVGFEVVFAEDGGPVFDLGDSTSARALRAVLTVTCYAPTDDDSVGEMGLLHTGRRWRREG